MYVKCIEKLKNEFNKWYFTPYSCEWVSTVNLIYGLFLYLFNAVLTINLYDRNIIKINLINDSSTA